MISQKVIDLAEKAKVDYLKEDEIYTSKEVKYGFVQRIIELAFFEALEAVERADIREKSYTTYDKAMLDFCKHQVKKEVQELINTFKT